MKKKGESALVWLCRKPVFPEAVTLFPHPSHVIYAGSNQVRENNLRTIVAEVDEDVLVSKAPTEEDPTPSIYDAAKSKAYKTKVKSHGTSPLIVASDVRTFLVDSARRNNHRTDSLANRGKPKNATEAQENFKLLLATARRTGRPAPYVVRAGTYMHAPANARFDDYAEYDVSIWLTREALEKLSTNKGFTNYRDEVIGRYEQDVLDMAAGFCLPVFLDRGYVAGINGHPLDTLPHADETIERAKYTAIVGIDKKAVQQRLGKIE